MKYHHQFLSPTKVLLLFLLTQNHFWDCYSSVHQKFKALSHSKLRDLYSQHYDNYAKYAAEYKQGIQDKRPEPHRLLAFAESLEQIKNHNELHKQGKSSFMLGLTSMSDMANEDMPEEIPVKIHNGTDFTPVILNLTADTVRNINWVTKEYVTPVIDVRYDRECYAASAAASAAGVMEAVAKSQTKQLVKLSMQELLDCSGSGCNEFGDFTKYAKYMMEKKGLVTDRSYPYVKGGRVCSANGKRYGRPVAVVSVYNISPKLFKALLAKGPVATRILVTDAFRNYVGGIFRGNCPQKNSYSHTVLAVGFADDHILIRNNWGTNWGEGGYMRISPNSEENCSLYLESLVAI